MSDIQKNKKYFKKEDLMKRLDWLAANAEIHNDLLVQAIALDSIAWMKEQENEYENGFNDAMQGKRELMYEGIDGKWYRKDW